jgi:hypothetical protein
MKKRFLAIICIISILCGLFALTGATTPHKANITDALEILMYLAGMDSVYDGTGISPTIEDALGVLVYLAGMEETVTVPIWAVTEPPVTTTEPPVMTTEPPVTTTEPSVTTTEPPVTTTEPPAATTEPPVTTTEPPVTTPQEEYDIRNWSPRQLEERLLNDFLEINPSHLPVKERVHVESYLITSGNSIAFRIGIGTHITFPDARPPIVAEIAGYVFAFRIDDLRVMIWNNGTIYAFDDEIYNSGMLTADEIGEIHRRYFATTAVTTTEPPVTTTEPSVTTTEPSVTDPNAPPTLCPELELRIRQDYHRQLTEWYESQEPGMAEPPPDIDNIKIGKYLGTYNESRVFFVAWNITVSYTMEIAGNVFEYGGEFRVWNNGNFFALSRDDEYLGAYELGLITDEEISKLWRLWVKINRKF